MKRTLSFCLAALLLGASLVSCGGKTGTKDGTADTDIKTDLSGTETETAEPAYVPTFTDRGGCEFFILSKMEGEESGRWTAEDFKIEEADGDTVNDAIFRRNSLLEESFNCSINNTFSAMGAVGRHDVRFHHAADSGLRKACGRRYAVGLDHVRYAASG